MTTRFRIDLIVNTATGPGQWEVDIKRREVGWNKLSAQDSASVLDGTLMETTQEKEGRQLDGRFGGLSSLNR